MTRALYAKYAGPLYAVRRLSDNATKDIPVLAAGGVADAAKQDAFCAGAACIVHRIYDQSPRGNHLHVSTGRHGPGARGPDRPVNATRGPLTLGGGQHAVYGAVFEGGMGYRLDETSGVATGDEPETLYYVVAGRYYNNKCCFDYGNAETNNRDDEKGTMEAIYWGDGCGGGTGAGPWVKADLENGCWAGNNQTDPNPRNTPIDADFVTAMVKGDSNNHFALKGGDAQKAGALKTLYDGARPEAKYNPMKKQGAIILGTGGDNSHGGIGTFYEGVMTSGFSSDATDAAVHANIVAAGYGI